MRIQVTFAKTDHMRYTSHLDVHRTWECMLRRAQLPLSYSQGFNPRPKINLAAALPLGFTSECEIVEFWLNEEIPLDRIKVCLQKAVPPGILLQTFKIINPQTPKIPNLVDSADYLVILLDSVPDLEQRIENILATGNLPRERRGKPYDLRPLIEALEIISTPTGDSVITMRLAARSGAVGRPEEVLLALGVDPVATRVHRKALNLIGV